MELKAVAIEVAKATMSVLQTMAQLESSAGVPHTKADLAVFGDITAYVKLEGNSTQGILALTFSKAAAIALVRGMLGDAIEDIMQDAKDAIGEITNMVSGQLRAKLSENGLDLHGSTPCVMFGSKQHIEYASTPLVIPFKSKDGSTFSAEFSL